MAEIRLGKREILKALNSSEEDYRIHLDLYQAPGRFPSSMSGDAHQVGKSRKACEGSAFYKLLEFTFYAKLAISKLKFSSVQRSFLNVTKLGGSTATLVCDLKWF